MHKKTHSCGFTLLEILFSITILVIGTAYFLSYMQRVQQHNRVTLAKTQLNTLFTAAIQYNSIYLQWPVSLEALTPFLGTDPSKNLSFCSPWRTATACAPYVIANTGRYFALKVLTPNSEEAQRLVSALSNAYIDTDGKTVIAYVTAFSNPPQPRPTGVLYASNQFNGSVCDTSSTAGSRSTGPYGLIDVTNTANTATVVYACDANTSSNIGYNPNTMACPAGSLPTMLLLPAALIPSDTISAGLMYYDYRYQQNTPGPGPYLEQHFNTWDYSSVGRNTPFLDTLCLDPTEVTAWPNPRYNDPPSTS